MKLLIILILYLNEAASTSHIDDCTSKPVDLVFVLDESGSVGKDNFLLQNEFVAHFVDTFDIGRNATQVAVITFSTKPQVEFYLNSFHDKPTLLSTIRNISYSHPGLTLTQRALMLAKTDILIKKHGRRKRALPFVLVMTDGLSMSRSATQVAAKELHDRNVTVFSIGISKEANMDELKAIASNSRNVIKVDAFSDLHSILAKTKQQACQAITGVKTPKPTKPKTSFPSTSSIHHTSKPNFRTTHARWRPNASISHKITPLLNVPKTHTKSKLRIPTTKSIQTVPTKHKQTTFPAQTNRKTPRPLRKTTKSASKPSGPMTKTKPSGPYKHTQTKLPVQATHKTPRPLLKTTKSASKPSGPITKTKPSGPYKHTQTKLPVPATHKTPKPQMKTIKPTSKQTQPITKPIPTVPKTHKQTTLQVQANRRTSKPQLKTSKQTQPITKSISTRLVVNKQTLPQVQTTQSGSSTSHFVTPKLPTIASSSEKFPSCDFESSSCGFFTSNHSRRWILRQANVSLPVAVPNYDHTLKNGSGHYMYIRKANASIKPEMSTLISPIIQSNNINLCLELYYYLNVECNCTLNVSLTYNHTNKDVPVWSIRITKGKSWRRTQLPVHIYGKVRIAVTASDTCDDIAIDDFKTRHGNCSVYPLSLATYMNVSASQIYPFTSGKALSTQSSIPGSMSSSTEKSTTVKQKPSGSSFSTTDLHKISNFHPTTIEIGHSFQTVKKTSSLSIQSSGILATVVPSKDTTQSTQSVFRIHTLTARTQFGSTYHLPNLSIHAQNPTTLKYGIIPVSTYNILINNRKSRIPNLITKKHPNTANTYISKTGNGYIGKTLNRTKQNGDTTPNKKHSKPTLPNWFKPFEIGVIAIAVLVITGALCLCCLKCCCGKKRRDEEDDDEKEKFWKGKHRKPMSRPLGGWTKGLNI